MSEALPPPSGQPPPLLVPEGAGRGKQDLSCSFDVEGFGAPERSESTATVRNAPAPASPSSFHDLFEQMRRIQQRLLQVYDAEVSVKRRKSVTISEAPDSDEESTLRLPGAMDSKLLTDPLQKSKSARSSQVPDSSASHYSTHSVPVHEPSRVSVDEMNSEQSEEAEFDLRPPWDISKTSLVKMQKKRLATTPSNFSRSGVSGTATGSSVAPERKFFHEGEAVAPDRSSCVVRPASKPRLFWDMLAIVVLLYDLVSVPLEAFHMQQSEMSLQTGFQLVVTLYWMMDIVASFLTAVYVNAKLYVRHWDIAKAYLRSWFIFDVTVLIPDILVFVDDANVAIEANGVGMARALRAGRLLRFLRFLRLLRIVKLFKLFYTLKIRFNSAPLLVALSILKFTMFSLYLAHVLACLWFAVGDVEQGWVREQGLQDVPFFEQYTTAVQWALSRVHPSTIQFSMQLKTPYERALAICASFIALGLSSVFISSITNTMAETSRKLQRKNQLLYSVREYCSAHFISASHAMSVKRYVEREHSRKKSLQTQLELLETLPQEILRELFHEARCQALMHHEFFDELGRKDPMMEMDLCSKAITESYILRHDKIFLPHEPATAMYMLCNGRCRYSYEAPVPVRPDKNHYSSENLMDIISGGGSKKPSNTNSVEKLTTATVTEKVLITRKHCLSEHSLWVKDWVHRGLLEAYKDGWLLSMNSDEAYKAIQAHPNSLLEATLHARQFVEALNVSYEDAHFVTDLPFHFQPHDFDQEPPKSSMSLRLFNAWKENLGSVNPAEEAFAAS